MRVAQGGAKCYALSNAGGRALQSQASGYSPRFWTGDVETHEDFVTHEVAADTVVFTVKSWLRNTVTLDVRHSPAAASQP